MKILSIGYIPKNTTVIHAEKNKYFYQPNHAFTGYDSFMNAQNPIDKDIIVLKQNIDEVILPFKKQYAKQFSQLGQIEYETQEKLDLVNSQEAKLLLKKIEAEDNKAFKNTETKTVDYKKYIDNIEEFKFYEELAKKEPFLHNQAVKEKINAGRERFKGEINEFNKFKPYYDTVQNTKHNMREELDKITLKSLPDVAEKIKNLKDKHRTAAGLLLFSDCRKINEIYKEYNAIAECNKDTNADIYKLQKRIALLHDDLKKFAENDNKEDSIDMINKFLDENSDNKIQDITKEEIKSVYEQLYTEADAVTAKYSEYLKKYDTDNKIEIDKKLINKTLKYQESVNKELASLIQKEKINKKKPYGVW